MTGEFNAELAEQIREEKYREATERLTELEQKGLNDAFPKLDTIASRVEAGDRSAMLELLAITAGSLRWFDALPQQTREALAEGLEKMRNNLEEAQGFLPRGRGERSESYKRTLGQNEFATAYAVEFARHVEGLSLEDAITKVMDESGMTDSLILKRWKRRHKDAKKNLSLCDALSDELIARWSSLPEWNMISELPELLKTAEMRCSTMPHRKKRQP
ncbi:MAG: hypothetical protein NTV11_16545 [Rhodocyclales bacterium]|nr:hypothetical protein [Rhodocyclales bacterium]